MEQKEFILDGTQFENFQGFVDEFNRIFVSQFECKWQGNLDAFNDYLTWPESEYVLRWKNSKKSKIDLGYFAMSLMLESNLKTCHPTGRNRIRKQLRFANSKIGETLFGTIVEIVESNSPFVELRFE